MPINLNKNDEALVKKVKDMIKEAYESADMPAAVAKSMSSYTQRFRNKGRAEAMRRHPFEGVCEASGKSLDKRDKVLDELEPEKGYKGKVRWVCPKANNSGIRSCGRCHGK